MASRVTARRRRQSSKSEPSASPSDLLVHRCRMLVRRGKHRQAAVALRQLAHRDQHPAAWVRLGIALVRSGRPDGAVDALKQGQWLHRQAGAKRRAEIVGALIEQLQRGAYPHAA